MYLIFLSGVAGDFAGASLCEKCGECEESCPQNLQIQKNLEKVSTEFEGKWLKPTAWFVKQVMAFQKWKDFRGAKK